MDFKDEIIPQVIISEERYKELLEKVTSLEQELYEVKMSSENLIICRQFYESQYWASSEEFLTKPLKYDFITLKERELGAELNRLYNDNLYLKNNLTKRIEAIEEDLLIGNNYIDWDKRVLDKEIREFVDFDVNSVKEDLEKVKYEEDSRTLGFFQWLISKFKGK